jgi:hypothetical protein
MVHLSGYINLQLWSSENLYTLHESPLHMQKISVWITISYWRIIGPIFFHQSTLNATVQKFCFLSLREIHNAYFQQDGATAHTANNSKKLLDGVFGERVIFKGIWPPSSPYLTPPDFFFWEAAKAEVCKNNPHALDELKTTVIQY